MTKTTTRNRHSHENFDFHDDIAKLKEILSDTALHVKDRAAGAINDSVENVKERSVEWQGNVTNYIAERPVKTLGIAMLSGMFLGYMILRKRSNSHRR